MHRIYLIDCPGIVYPSGDIETEIILKSVVSLVRSVILFKGTIKKPPTQAAMVNHNCNW